MRLCQSHRHFGTSRCAGIWPSVTQLSNPSLSQIHSALSHSQFTRRGQPVAGMPLVAFGPFPRSACGRADSPISYLGEASSRVPALCSLAGMPRTVWKGWEPALLASGGGQTCCASLRPTSCHCAKHLLHQWPPPQPGLPLHPFCTNQLGTKALAELKPPLPGHTSYWGADSHGASHDPGC